MPNYLRLIDSQKDLKDFLENPPKEIVKFPSEILRQDTKPIQSFTDELRDICRIMFKLMYKFKGVGLAAPQVGLPYRLFIANPTLQQGKEQIFINPEIFHVSTRTTKDTEGCLSIPGVYCEIIRPRKVMFRSQDLDGKTNKHCYEGMMGRVCQHEIDHLFNTLIIDKLSETEYAKIKPILHQMSIPPGVLP